MAPRIVQKVKGGPLALGWLIGDTPKQNEAMRKALPGWNIVLDSSYTVQAPSRAQLEKLRMMVGCPLDVPTLLLGWSAGCQTVRSLLVAHAIPSLFGVGVFDGTSATIDAAGKLVYQWQIDVWRAICDRAAKDEIVFIATCSSMGYTERLRPGTANHGMACKNVLSRVVGQTLEPGKPLRVGRAYVEQYAGPDIDHNGHLRQQNEIMPRLLAELVGSPHTWLDLLRKVTIEPVRDLFAGLVREVQAEALGSSLGERVAAWCVAQSKLGIKERPGAQHDLRIVEYLAPCQRGGDALAGMVPSDVAQPGALVGLTSDETSWCAAARSAAVLASLEEGDVPPHGYRISVRELCEDAKECGALHVVAEEPDYAPGIGDGAIFSRDGQNPLEGGQGHVATVVALGREPGTYYTKGGNENNAWTEEDPGQLRRISETLAFIST